MRLTLIAKDAQSGGKGCPSVYVSDSGEMVVQGVQLAASELAELQNPLPGETAVRIAPDVVLEAAERYRQNGD